MTTNRPQSILWFERLFFASLAVTAIDLFVHRDLFFGDMGEGTESGFELFGIFLIVGVFGFGLSLLLWFFITYRVSRIARSIYTIFFVLGIVSIMGFFQEYSISELVFAGITQALTLASVIFLYRPDSDVWFLSKGHRTGDEKDGLSDIFQ